MARKIGRAYKFEPALLLLEVADGREGLALQARAADERAVDVGARHQLVNVLGVDRATILNDHIVGDGVGVVLDEPRAHVRVRLLGHLGGGGEACAQ